jgi:hypothetical protein
MNGEGRGVFPDFNCELGGIEEPHCVNENVNIEAFTGPQVP